MKKKKETNLGKYLYSLRIQRGFVNISDYLRKYDLPISDVYYRDVESGTKIVSLETASDFCDALQADRRVFYFHLLRDLLPDDIISTLLLPIVDETFSSLEERQALLERDKQIYREAFAKSLLAETHVLSEEAVRMFLSRPELMPVLHFLYATEFATAEQMASILDRNAIREPAEQVARLFTELGMAVIEGDPLTSRNWRIKRRSVISRVPLTEDGKKLKHAFALREVGKTLQQKPFNVDWSDLGSFENSSILELSPESVKSVRARILDALAEAQAGEEPISSGRSIPYFFGIFVGSRPEYSPENVDANSSKEILPSDTEVNQPNLKSRRPRVPK